MYTDLFGKKRLRLALHQHTTRSDGRKTPEEVARLYREAGYDAIALTDHWVYGGTDSIEGLPILAGAEYHVGHRDAAGGIFHILCLFADRAPSLDREMTAQEIIDGIHAVGGIAVLAHPAWSLNTPEMIKGLRGVDATEIFNAGSERGMNRRGDSSLVVDMLATDGIFYPLLATDDAHRYGQGNDADGVTSSVMVECDSLEPEKLKEAILAERFYATTGPEIHLSREGNRFIVDCSPACEVVFFSNSVWSSGRVVVGEELTHAEFDALPEERYIRACVTDRNGGRAWSNIIKI